MFKKIKSGVHAFLENNRGVAAVEFALILPVMIAIYIGTVEVTLLLSMDRKASHTASVVGDLVTQYDAMDQATMDDIVQATRQVMGTDNVRDMKITVQSYYKDSGGRVEERGSVSVNGGVAGNYNIGGLNQRVFARDSGIVIARIEYSYKSPTGIFLQGTRKLEETFILKPRRTNYIDFTPKDMTYNLRT